MGKSGNLKFFLLFFLQGVRAEVVWGFFGNFDINVQVGAIAEAVLGIASRRDVRCLLRSR